MNESLTEEVIQSDAERIDDLVKFHTGINQDIPGYEPGEWVEVARRLSGKNIRVLIRHASKAKDPIENPCCY